MAGSSDRPRLRRSRDERVLAGVCGGLAEYFGVDPTLVRIGVVLATLFPPLSAISLVGYGLLAVILPEEGSEHLPGRERVRQNLEGLRADVSDLAGTVRGGLGGAARDRRPAASLDAAPAARRDEPGTETEIERAAAGYGGPRTS